MFTQKQLSGLIIPLIIEQVLAITVGMFDVMMVSRAGEAAVSGVSLVDMVNVLLINIFAALATGGAVVCAQYIGCKSYSKARKAANQLILITGLLSLGIMAIALFFRKPLLSMIFGQVEDGVMQNALIYFLISALSYPFVALYNSCAALFRSMGNSKISMRISILMNVINVVGNAFFIFVFHLGAAGVAISSLISRAIAAVIMFILLQKAEGDVYLEKHIKFSLDKPIVKKILYIGIPNALENGMFQLGRILVVSIIAAFGTIQITANAVANNVDSLGCIPGQAISLAMVTVVGQCIGAGDFNQVKHYTKKLLKITYVIMGVLNIGLLVFLPFILKLYALSHETIKLATLLIFIHNGFAIFLWPLSFTLPNALRAANDVKFTMVVSIFSMWFFRIGLSYVFGKWLGLGAIGVWIAMLADWIFRVICFVWRFLSEKWKSKHLA